jgi:hypothetical protein
MMLLNNDGSVLIQDYDPSWPDAFVKTRRQSQDRLSERGSLLVVWTAVNPSLRLDWLMAAWLAPAT